MQPPQTLEEMVRDPEQCTYAYLDPSIGVPEIVLVCIRYLRQVSDSPGGCVC